MTVSAEVEKKLRCYYHSGVVTGDVPPENCTHCCRIRAAYDLGRREQEEEIVQLFRDSNSEDEFYKKLGIHISEALYRAEAEAIRRGGQ